MKAIALFLAASLLGAVGQFLYKAGANRATGGWSSYLLNSRILAGAACYLGVMASFVAAFKSGAKPALLYPLYATTFIWAAVIGAVAHGTAIRPPHVAGMILLVAGMILMGR